MTSTSYKVRAATEHDQDAMTEVRRRAWHVAYDHSWGPGPIEQMFAGDLMMSWDSPEPDWAGPRTTLVAVETAGEALVGVINYGIHRNGTGEVRLLYVDPEHHARGVGTLLWDEAIRAMKGDGADGLVVWVLGRNQPARDWYEHRGLSPFATSRVRLGDQVEVEIGYSIHQEDPGKRADKR